MSFSRKNELTKLARDALAFCVRQRQIVLIDDDDDDDDDEFEDDANFPKATPRKLMGLVKTTSR